MVPSPLPSPPRPLNAQGLARRVGVELEFGELDPQPAAQLIANRFGGTQVEIDPHRFAVRGARIGDFSIELDIRRRIWNAGPTATCSTS